VDKDRKVDRVTEQQQLARCYYCDRPIKQLYPDAPYELQWVTRV
jgi:hypothetical protein